MKNFYAALLGVLLSGLIIGCGGGHSTGIVSRATGRATFTMQWPERSRLIPAAANSIVLTIRQGEKAVASKTLARPASGGTATAVFEDLPPGDLTTTASAYPQANGTGTAQATASVPLHIQANQNSTFTLTMLTTIVKIELSPDPVVVFTGESRQLTATAKDAADAIVLLSPGKLTWQSSNTGAATVDANGTVHGLNTGETVITVQDTESNVSTTLTVTVRIAPPIMFQAPRLFNVPTGADEVVAADFDGDGKPDVATPGFGEVVILYGKGDGTLEPYRSVGSWTGIAPHAAADVNRDGKIDLLCTGGGGNVLVLINQGNRTFAAPVPTTIGTCLAIAAADFNRDTWPDMAVVLPGDGAGAGLVILLNKGDGTFRNAQSLSVPHIATRVGVGDLNGDGVVDCAVGTYASTIGRSGFVTFFNDGNGTFTSGPGYDTGDAGEGAVIADFDGDSKNDVAIPNYWSGTLAVLFGNGMGTYSNLTQYPIGAYPLVGRAADLNKDGRLDIVVSSAGADFMTVLRNLGGGFFASGVTYATGNTNSRTCDVADFNRDGKMDVVVSQEGPKTVAILLNSTP